MNDYLHIIIGSDVEVKSSIASTYNLKNINRRIKDIVFNIIIILWEIISCVKLLFFELNIIDRTARGARWGASY